MSACLCGSQAPTINAKKNTEGTCEVFLSDISEWNNNYSNTFDFSVFHFEGPWLQIHYVNILIYLYNTLVECVERELHETKLCECDFLQSCRELSIHVEQEQGKSVPYESENKVCALVKLSRIKTSMCPRVYLILQMTWGDSQARHKTFWLITNC